MSLEYLPAAEAIQNGSLLDAVAINTVIQQLSEAARWLAGDVLGRAIWIDGGDISATLDGDDLFVEVKDVDTYLFEPSTQPVRALRVGTRCRQGTRSVNVDKDKDLLLAMLASNADEQLGMIQIYDPVRDFPPQGVVPLHWIGTGFTDLHATVDARPHPVYGVSMAPNGYEAHSRTAWIPVPDAKAAVCVYPGERLLVTLEVNGQDGLVSAIKDNNFVPKDRADNTKLVVALNGYIPPTDADPLRVGYETAFPETHTHTAIWIINPFAANPGLIFGTPDPTQGGPILVELQIRGFAAKTDKMLFSVRVLPAECVPG